MASKAVLLFSYGTLQHKAVQLRTFGRELSGENDQLIDYCVKMIKIDDDEVVALSGKTHHPVAVRKIGEKVSGKVFEVSQQELAHADSYEVSDYQRTLGKMASGKRAWAYVQHEV